MPRFIVHTKEKQKRRTLLWAYFLIVVGLFSFVLFIFFDGRNDLSGIASMVIAMNALASGINQLRNVRKVRFIEVDKEHIAWGGYEKFENIIPVDWNDIRWIKKEKDGGITLFQDSSFSKHISLAKFSDDDQNEIMLLLQQIATERRIRMINFSGAASAVA